VSKASRRRPQTGNPSPAGAQTADLATSASAAATGAPRSSTSPSARSSRRERQRTAYKPSFFERYRTAIIVVAALVGVGLLSIFVFTSAAQPTFACSTIWTPDPTPSPAPGSTPALGYAQPDMGHTHVSPGEKVTYTYCAPASGKHINVSGQGPIAARVYGPNDAVIPQGWIHNLEHGGLVILYKGDSAGATDAGQAEFKAFWEAFPPAQDCGPVIARFDEMSSPFQAMVWGRVLLLDTFDQEQIDAFWNQWGGITNTEKICPTPNQSGPLATAMTPTDGTATAVPSAAALPSASPATEPSPSADPSPATEPSPSAAPSAS
jgi:Protein of unknown function (DUF3105)